MKMAVRKWGNSAAVRIPAAVMAATRMELDAEVEVRAEGGRIVIEPARRKRYKLSDLLRGIRPENLHREVETGRAVGHEVW
ncbi:MAG TPA: AbrB/MazE/SpoVT family DNA-binding domain-containing protein [Terriglobales bacterium]|nr:AbrB/MazE/SpoVT family DNA-binding domain-containing protein [Terriglobales bacterium]